MKRILAGFPLIAPSVITLWIGFIALRCYEVFQIRSAGESVKGSYIATGILFDLFCCLVILGIFSFFQALVLFLFRRKIAWLFHFFALTALIADFALIEYYLAMRVPLDESLFFFSLSELKLIVGLGQRLSVGVIAGLAGIIVVYFLLSTGIRRLRFTSGQRFSNASCVAGMLACCLCWFALYRNDQKPQASALINNKLTYFSGKSIAWLLGGDPLDRPAVLPEDFKNLDPAFLSSGSIGETYPLVHDLPDESPLSACFNKGSGKPPNVVIIIVESLSSDLVGVKAGKTAHLMPFLDSLSKKSLYFPNALSTSERTHNVLPAVLASVPNTPNGKMLQCMRYPQHWSLISLLKDRYYSRFYCGVDLSYSNMRGFMNYQQTDYLVNHWGKQYSKVIDGTESPWGYPDGALFDQSFDDLRKLDTKGKSRLDVFLTISTHDPFIYPEAAKYTQLVLDAVKKAPHKTAAIRAIERKARSYGAYAYCDAQLRRFFEKASRRPDFENTIFIITGDHGTELCQYDVISSYKVPMIIYSPLLKRGKTFPAVSTHLDLTPSIYNFLRLNYLPELPSAVPFIGGDLDMRPEFHTDRALVFNTTQLKNLYLFRKGYAQLYGQLFRIDRTMQPHPVNDPAKLKQLNAQLEQYEAFCEYTMYQDRIVSPILSSKYGKREVYTELDNFTKEVRSADLQESGIDIGAFPVIPATAKRIRLTFTCEVYCKTKEDLDSFPEMAVSLENMSPQKLLYFGTVRPYFERRFRPKAWNKVEYTLVLQLKDLEKVDNNNCFKYYLMNLGKKYHPMRHFHTVVSRDAE